MKKYLYILLLAIFCCACGSDVVSEEGEEFGNTAVTETVLTQTESSDEIDLSFSRKSRYENLVASLYREALVQDQSLKALEESIQQSILEQLEISKLFNNYHSNISAFYTDGLQYSESIEDSLVKQEANTILNKYNADCTKTLNPFKAAHIQSLNNLAKIHDNHKLLKIHTATKMMSKYIKEEKLDLIAFKDNIKTQENVLAKIKAQLE